MTRTAQVLRLVQPPATGNAVDEELVSRLQDLLRWARSGDLTGLSLVVYLEDSFFVDAIGEPLKFPEAARGYLRSLDDKLKANT